MRLATTRMEDPPGIRHRRRPAENLRACRKPTVASVLGAMSAYSASNSFPASDLTERLSDRQRQCLALAAQGLSSARIAGRIGISARTVDEHLMLACRALGVRTRIQAVARLARQPQRLAEPRTFLP